MQRVLIALLVLLGVTLLIVPQPAHGSGCGNYIVTNYRAPYVAPVYHHQSYPVAVPVVINPEYFYSVRDGVLADAAAFRAAKFILDVQNKGGSYNAPVAPVNPTQPAQPFAPRKETGSATSTEVDPKFSAFVSTNCIQCHSANLAAKNGGIDLSNLATVPLVTRYDVLFALQAGTMPLNPQDRSKVLPVDPANVQLTVQWVFAAKQVAKK